MKRQWMQFIISDLGFVEVLSNTKNSLYYYMCYFNKNAKLNKI